MSVCDFCGERVGMHEIIDDDARGEDPFGYRAEAVTLMRLAESLAAR